MFFYISRDSAVAATFFFDLMNEGLNDYVTVERMENAVVSSSR